MATLNLKDYGAVGDGVTDDSLAVRNWVAALSGSNRDLYAPSGTYRVIGRVDGGGHPFAFRGDGQKVSIFTFEGASGGFHFTQTGTDQYIGLCDFSCRAKDTLGYGLELVWPASSGVWWAQGQVERVELIEQDLGYFQYACAITNGSNVLVDRLVARQRSPQHGIAGVYFDGTCVDCTIQNSHILQTQYAVTNALTAVAEGLRVLNPTFIDVDYGVYRARTSPGSVVLTVVEGGHIHCRKRGVYLDWSPQSIVSHVDIYKQNSTEEYVGIHVLHSDDVRIRGNEVIRLGSPGVENGIVFGYSEHFVIEGNILNGMNTGIWAQFGANNGSIIGNRGSVFNEGAGNYEANNTPY